MRVLVSSVGTRGDVQPALALALQFRELGHAVRLCVPPNFIAQAGDLGLQSRAIGVEMRRPATGSPAPAPSAGDLIADQFEVIHDAAAGCDLIVGAGVHQYAARSVAEARDIPCVVAAYAPVSLPSAAHPPPGPELQRDSSEANLAAWDAYRQGWNRRALDRINANREHLRLMAIDDVLDHILGEEPWLAADATLGPAPAALEVLQTGAWILRDPRPLADALEAFLEGGDPPIYLGVGSMPAPQGLARTFIEAARAVGRRAILSKGWAGLGLLDQGADCIEVDYVNHQLLFPRVAAVIHHGGAGTTTAAALAGVPQLATPMFSDQFYWGKRLGELGIGSAVAAAGLTSSLLAPAIADTLSSAARDRARSAALRVSSNGAAQAARLLTERFG